MSKDPTKAAPAKVEPAKAAPAKAEPKKAEPKKAEPKKATAPKTVTVTVTEHHQTRGVNLRVNGIARNIPLNKPTTIPADMLESLDVAGVKYTVAK